MQDPSVTNQELLEEISALKDKIRELEQSELKRKLAGETLRESEERYRSLATTADSMYLVDSSCRYLFMNEGHLSRFGVTLDKIVGRAYGEFHSKENTKAFVGMVKGVFETGSSKQIEYRSERDGRYFIRTFSPVRDRDGKSTIAVTVVSKDITDRKRAEEALQRAHDELEKRVADRTKDLMRLNEELLTKIADYKRAEEALRENEQKIRAIFDQTFQFIGMMTPDGTLIEANRTAMQFAGINESDCIGKPFWDTPWWTHSPEMQNKLREALTEALKGKVVRLEVTHPAADGSIHFIDFSLKPVFDELGKIIFIIPEGRDVTARKKAEESLRDIEARYTMIMNNISDRIWLADMNFKIIWASESVTRDRGYHIEEMNPFPFEKLLPPDSLQIVERTISEELTPQRLQQKNLDISKTLELEFFRKDGSTFWSEVKIMVIRDHHGTPNSILGVGRDITERKRAEEERREFMKRLTRAEKIEGLGRLAGGVAHDLNNVLGVLVGYSEFILDKLPENSPLRRYADNIMQSGMRAAAIIQDLLTLARRGVSVSEVVDLNRLVLDYFRTPEFEKLKSYYPDIKIRTDLEKELLKIKGSPVHLSKTIMNLLSNAAEAISGQGEVTLRTENRYLDQPEKVYDEMKEGDYAVLTISDTGSGISTDDLDKIFEPFYTKKVMGRSGTGLGLAVVWGTVKDHDGCIDVQSEVGKGTTFTLYFPATREEMGAVEKSASLATYMSKGESILVVDDVKEQRELTTNMLERLGYKVEAVASGEEAIEYLKNKKPDLIVLDMIVAPGIDGMETYRRIIEINPVQKAVIVSGYSETDRVRKAQEMGAGSFVRKPYILEKIGLAIRKELDWK